MSKRITAVLTRVIRVKTLNSVIWMGVCIKSCTYRVGNVSSNGSRINCCVTDSKRRHLTNLVRIKTICKRYARRIKVKDLQFVAIWQVEFSSNYARESKKLPCLNDLLFVGLSQAEFSSNYVRESTKDSRMRCHKIFSSTRFLLCEALFSCKKPMIVTRCIKIAFKNIE